MYVAKSLSELQNGYHGAPPSDRLVIRSSWCRLTQKLQQTLLVN
jgi:hypothetical protein